MKIVKVKKDCWSFQTKVMNIFLRSRSRFRSKHEKVSNELINNHHHKARDLFLHTTCTTCCYSLLLSTINLKFKLYTCNWLHTVQYECSTYCIYMYK